MRGTTLLLPYLVAGKEELLYHLLGVVAVELLCTQPDVVETKGERTTIEGVALLCVVGVVVDVIVLLVVVEQLGLRDGTESTGVVGLGAIEREDFHQQRLTYACIAHQHNVLVEVVVFVMEDGLGKRRAVEVVEQETNSQAVVVVDNKASVLLCQDRVGAGYYQLAVC